MILVLRAVSLNDDRLSQPIVGRFDDAGGSIGRADSNTMMLPDPERLISRTQARVGFGGGSFFVEDVGSSNPVLHNGRALGPGARVQIKGNDELQIGGYRLKADFETDIDAKTITRGRVTGPGPGPASSFSSAARPNAPASPADPFADLAPAAPAAALPAAAAPSTSNPFADLAPAGSSGSADPFAGLGGFGSSPPPAPAAPLAATTAAPMPAVPPFAGDPFAGIGPAVTPAPVVAPPARSAAPFGDLVAPPSPARAPSGADPFGDLLGSGSGAPSSTPSKADPFADLLNAGGSSHTPPQSLRSVEVAPRMVEPPRAEPPAQLSAVQAGSPMHAPLGLPPTAAAPAGLPSDFDPFAGLGPAPAPTFGTPAPAGAPPPAGDLFSDLLGSGTPASGGGGALDDFLKPASAAPETPGRSGRSDDALSSFMSSPAPGTGQPALDPMGLFAPPPATTDAERQPAVADHTPGLQSSFTPPRLLTEAPADDVTAIISVAKTPAPPPGSIPEDFAFTDLASPPPAPTPAPAPAAVASFATDPLPTTATSAARPSTPDALWQGFLDGAGVKIDLPQGMTPELMRTIGQMLRLSIEGMLPMIAVRAAAKNELRAKMTVIQSRNNNPLKFAPDANAALMQMLQPPARGFLAGPAAINDAMDDLQSHLIATMAGMRAALEGVLGRFDPQPLEARLAKGSLDGILPMNRRSKLWELYLEHYRSLRAEAEDDFHELFGKAFVEAYEAQIDRIDRSRAANPG